MSVGNVCSDEFISAIGYEQFGYSFARGTITDVGELVERGVGISCLNLSCGYYHAHSDEETTILPELENCLNFVAHIVETCTEVYPFVYERRTFTNYGNYRNYGRSYGCGYGYGRYSDYYGSDNALDGDTLKGYDRNNEINSTYVDDGYFESDIEIMKEYLRVDLNVSFDYICECCVEDFNVEYFTTDDDVIRATLQDVYDKARKEVIEEMEY